MTRNGSAAANGIAPSVINEKPRTKLDKPDWRSASVNLSLNNRVAKPIANGGIIPPAITAAIKAPSPVSV